MGTNVNELPGTFAGDGMGPSVEDLNGNAFNLTIASVIGSLGADGGVFFVAFLATLELIEEPAAAPELPLGATSAVLALLCEKIIC